MRVVLFNLALLALALGLGYSALNVWTTTPPQHLPLPTLSRRDTPTPPRFTFQRAIRPQNDYGIIVDESLFYPTRREPLPPPTPVKPGAAEDEKRTPAPVAAPEPTIVAPKDEKPVRLEDVQLFGTLIYGPKARFAILKVGSATPRRPGNLQRVVPPPAQRTTRHYRVGQKVGDFRIVEIERDRVVLESNGQKETLLVRDPTMLKDRPKAPASPPPAAKAAAPPQPARPAAAAAAPAAQPAPAAKAAEKPAEKK
ncbi:MAG: hypothetical protein HYY96_06145 [Candidatus Tectomicrobia bacterium]|nr:hypothetical protein [Candidatus Tectomicrobia bacterium]